MKKMKVFGKEVEVNGYTRDPQYFKSGYFLGSSGRNDNILLSDGTSLNRDGKHGFLGLKDRESGDIFLLDMYGYDGYNHTYELESQVQHVDTSTRKRSTSIVLKAYGMDDAFKCLKEVYRKDPKDYSLVLLEVKNRDRQWVYYTGKIGKTRANYVGKGPLERNDMERIKEVYVLIDSLDKSIVSGKSSMKKLKELVVEEI
tara:strand:- start:2823 stop:3422 length:600 start_codon:yes stop_codon:yes gene_type:complete